MVFPIGRSGGSYFFKVCQGRGSNSRLPVYDTGALPLSYPDDYISAPASSVGRRRGDYQ